jgi:D-lactate dehydrogenase
MARLAAGGDDPALLDALGHDYPWMAIDTCAADGLCATACPVGIDTGQLVKRLRRERHPAWAQSAGRFVAERFQEVEALARTALRGGHLVDRVFGDGSMEGLTRALRQVMPAMPAWASTMPRAASTERPATSPHDATAIYFPSCISRMMGAMPGEPDDLSLCEAIVAVSARARRPVHVPHDVAGTCCGVPFSSKGFDAGHRAAANQAIERFWTWSDEGRLPIVIDTSPCTYGLRTCRAWLTAGNQEHFDRLRLLDIVEHLHGLLPHLAIHRLAGTVALHPVCSLTRMGLAGTFEEVAHACCEAAVTPPSAGCCAMAGDRGLLIPDLARAATVHEASEVRELGAVAGCSTSRTCEVNLTRETGLTYRSVAFLVERATRDGVTTAPAG